MASVFFKDLIQIKNLFINLCLSVFAIGLTILIVEISVRVYNNEFSFHNFLELKIGLFRSAYPTEFDKELGWIPKKGNHPKNVWNTKVTILNDGIRSNENIDRIESEETILAVGDSFTFGDQVSNDETWPAILEDISHKRVINGGVFGYGVDQSYLRMQALVSKYHPDYIVFSLIPSDIHRCELSERTSVPKPYFNLSENGDLVLINEHVRSHNPKEVSLDIFRKVMGYSYLAHILVSKVAPEYWLQGLWRSTQVHSKGAEVTCAIFKQLNQYAQKTKVKLYILIQYAKDAFERKHGDVDKAITCIDNNVATLVDLRTSLSELKKHDIDEYESLFDNHMTREGNKFVASRLLDVISTR